MVCIVEENETEHDSWRDVGSSGRQVFFVELFGPDAGEIRRLGRLGRLDDRRLNYKRILPTVSPVRG